MRKHTTPSLILFAVMALASLLLAACREEKAPVIVYVTPTPSDATESAAVITPATIAASASPAATSDAAPADTPTTATAAATPRPTIAPGVAFGAIAGAGTSPSATAQPSAAAPSTAAPTVLVTPASPVPGLGYGAIVGPGYTIPPTETRLPPSPVPTTEPTAGPSPTPYPGLDPARVGIQIHANIGSNDFARVLGHAHTLNVTWIKMQFNWSLLEYAPGVYTDLFYGMRRYVQQAHDDGFKVMVSVAKAPGWSRTPDSDGVMRENGPPDDPQALANFMSGMLSMIGTDAAGRPYVDAIEVWNEPNLEREWYGRPLTGDDYMRYFAPAYSAIRQFSPAITIVTAGPAPTGDSVWSTNDRTWLQQMYNAGLARYGADVQVGIHPYGWANPPEARCCSGPTRGWDDQPQFFFLDTVEDYRRIMVANGHSGSSLWSTEFGWPTFDGLIPANGGPTPAPPSDEAYFGFINQWEQADYTLRALVLAQQRDYLGPMILWNLNFSTIPTAIENGDKKTGYSLLTGQWQPRPIYTAIQQALVRN